MILKFNGWFVGISDNVVSILVLMEYDLKDDKFPRFQPQTHVSILVLMEYDLKVWPNWKIQAGTASFNPCSNGI